MNQQSRIIALLLIGTIALVGLAGCAAPATPSALAASPTVNPASLPRPRSAVEQALRDYYAGNTSRPISDYQEVGVIDEGSTRLVLFTYRVADRRADTANPDGSPHWEPVVGSGVAGSGTMVATSFSGVAPPRSMLMEICAGGGASGVFFGFRSAHSTTFSMPFMRTACGADLSWMIAHCVASSSSA